MSKSDVSACSSCPLAKDASENTIEFQLEDKLTNNSNAVIKLLNVTNFLGRDLTKYKIIGDHEIKSHKDNITYIKGTFTIRDNKTKKIEQLAVDFVKELNEVKYTGVVTLFISDQPDKAKFKVGKKVLCSTKNLSNGNTVKGTLDHVTYVWGQS